MKRNHKIIISIGIVLLVFATAGVVFQVDKTLASNRQQQLQVTKEKSDKEKEQKYREVIMAISYKVHNSPSSEDRFPESQSILESLDGYLDSNYIIEYVKAYKESLKPSPDYLLAISYLEKIPFGYRGDLATEVSNARRDWIKGLPESPSSKIIKDKYEKDYDKDRASRPSISPVKPQKPQIGMSADEVITTPWGKPKNVNRTTTAYGVNEQWVYSSGRYVYLDNGIVTAIQD